VKLPSATGMAAEVLGQTKHAMLRSKLRKMAGMDTEGGMPGDGPDMGSGTLTPDEAAQLMEALGSESGNAPPNEPQMDAASAMDMAEAPSEENEMPVVDASENEAEEPPMPKRRGLRY